MQILSGILQINLCNLLRLNLSHVALKNLASTIKFIKKYSKIPICIDTEGAQIRTKVSKIFQFKNKQKGKIYKSKGNFNLYPDDIFSKLKLGDILDIGFDNLKIKITKKAILSMYAYCENLPDCPELD